MERDISCRGMSRDSGISCSSCRLRVSGMRSRDPSRSAPRPPATDAPVSASVPRRFVGLAARVVLSMRALRPAYLLVRCLPLYLFFVCAACQQEREAGAGLPELPPLRLESASSEARAELEAARSEAVRRPTDGVANGRLGMTLQAYDLFPEALVCYRRAAALDSADWRWPYYSGLVNTLLGRHEEAVRFFRTALAMRPDFVAARIRLGESLLAVGEVAESRSVYRRAIEAAPSSAAALYGLGKACEADGDDDAALDAYERSVRLAPQAGAVHYALALLYRRSGRVAEAREHLAVAANGNRSVPAVDDPQVDRIQRIRRDKHWHLQQGLAADLEGRLEDAVSEYQRALVMDAEYLQAHVNLIAAFGKLGRVGDAERHYRKALSVEADALEIHINWGTLQVSQGRLAEAVRSFRRGLEINPYSASLHADLGALLLRSGQASDASRHLRKALELEPQHRLANFHLARHPDCPRTDPRGD